MRTICKPIDSAGPVEADTVRHRTHGLSNNADIHKASAKASWVMLTTFSVGYLSSALASMISLSAVAFVSNWTTVSTWAKFTALHEVQFSLIVEKLIAFKSWKRQGKYLSDETHGGTMDRSVYLS
ncbi:unnamed protein product [Dicrocoelium dendriticum]|nr:unnamed protein product [Dicrocoelium dendriticum]